MWELKQKKQYRLYGRLGINNISQFLIYQEVVDNVTCEEEAIDCTSIPVIDFVLLFDYMTDLLTIEGDFILWLWWHDNRFEVNWPPEPTLVLRWISKFFLFGALPSDTLKIKHTKNLKEIPSRHVLENLPEKACMNAFIHLKLISNVQGFN